MSTISDLANATPVGLSLDDKLSYAEWESVGFDLAKVGKAMQWWIGDWVNYGGKRYGETYKAAIEATGMSPKTCQTYALISKAFEMPRRRGNLAFGHHVEVWSLEPGQQDELLDRAETEGLSCAKLRELVRSINSIDEIERGEANQEIERQADHRDSQEDTENWSEIAVKAFRKAENRLEAMRLMIDTLEPFEAAIVRDWAIKRLH